jgi:hypothetical protein
MKLPILLLRNNIFKSQILSKIGEIMEKTIKAIQLTNKYCDEEYILNKPCYMYGCNSAGKYAKKHNEAWIFHCKSHATKEHMRIVP